MKVIRKFDPEMWTREYTCRCLSLLEINIKDLKYHTDFKEGDYAAFTCPVCSHTNTIDIKLIFPPAVRNLIERAR